MLIPLREDMTPHLRNLGREDFTQFGLKGVDNQDGAFLGYPLSEESIKSFSKNNKNFIGSHKTKLIPFEDKNKYLIKIFQSRRSSRQYLGTAMPFEKLSQILQCSMGTINEETEKYQGDMRRVYPSGGALYSVDAYLLVKNVNGLEQGVYHYCPRGNELSLIRSENLALQSYLYDQPQFENLLETTNVAIILCGFFEKSYFKYGERAWKLALLEAGHIAQNFYLTCAEDSEVGICGHGGFHNSTLLPLLELNSKTEQILFPLTLGMI